MIKILCRSNLDLSHAEKWPSRLVALPRKGDRIMSAHNWGTKQAPRHLCLEVIGVTFVPVEKECYDGPGEEEFFWRAEVELNLPPSLCRSVNEFQRSFYPRLQGKSAPPYVHQDFEGDM